MTSQPKKAQTGFTLIEVLVSLLILAFGLLGIGGMLGFTLKSNSSSYLKQLSVQSASTIVDRMRANKAAAIGGDYSLSNLTTGTAPATPATNCISTACTPAQLATFDYWDWQVNDVARQLPNGLASISTSLSGNGTLVTITVQWDDRPAQSTLGSSTAASAPGSPNLARFVTSTIL